MRRRLIRLPVGSSATMSGGSLASARTMAARCCWPPLTMLGSLCAWSASPTMSSSSSARRGRWRCRVLAGQVHGRDDILEQRQRRQQLEELEDDADRLPRQRARPFSLSLCTGWPSTITLPAVGRSMPVIMLSIVDLPLPDGPMIATNSPAFTWSETVLRISISLPPTVKRLTTSRRSMMGSKFQTATWRGSGDCRNAWHPVVAPRSV